MRCVGQKALSLLAAGTLCLCGCQSLTVPASATFASVKISGHTPQEVMAETVKVFENEGYRTISSTEQETVFEREGTRWDQIAYGDHVGKDQAVVSRVKAEIVDLGGGVYRLQCNAYMVSDVGTTFEDEEKVGALRRGAYRALLDKVIQRLTVTTSDAP